MGDGRFTIWQTWLFWACLSTAGLGVMLTFFDTQLLPGLPRAVNESLWGTADMPADVVTYHRFVHAVLGATIASWAAVLAFVARGPFRRREPWAWWCFVVALGIWFPLDTAMSLRFGVWANAVFNVVALVTLAPPLVFTRRAFARA